MNNLSVDNRKVKMAVLAIYRGVTLRARFPFSKRGIEEMTKSKVEEIKERAVERKQCLLIYMR